MPQITYVWLGKGTRDISLLYLLLNVICSTEHLFFVFYHTINLPIETEYWAHHPQNALDWVNSIQSAGVWALFNLP